MKKALITGITGQDGAGFRNQKSDVRDQSAEDRNHRTEVRIWRKMNEDKFS